MSEICLHIPAPTLKNVCNKSLSYVLFVINENMPNVMKFPCSSDDVITLSDHKWFLYLDTVLCFISMNFESFGKHFFWPQEANKIYNVGSDG